MSTKEIATRIVETMTANNLTLCFAESCTAGGIPKVITSVPGASKVLIGGTTAYHPIGIAHALGLANVETLLETYNPVSEEITEALAEVSLDTWKADICIATTGYLGPYEDDLPEHHEGWVVVTARDGVSLHHNVHLEGRREANRQAMLRVAFELVELMLKRLTRHAV